MADWNELKRLAEAATPGPWEASNYFGKRFIANIEVIAMDADGQRRVILQGNQNFMEEAVANVAFAAAANPAAILALIAENERLDATCHEFASQAEFAKRQKEHLLAERDQLRAEVERLRASRLYWVAPAGSGLVRCVSDERYRKFSPSIRARYEPVRVVGDSALAGEPQA